MRRTRFEARLDKRSALNKAEDQGIVAGSIDVRMGLVSRMKAGEITLHEAQAELRKIQRDAKKNGKLTRSQVYREA